jgi:hypothetical protein
LSGVGSQVIIQQAKIEEMRTGISILQSQGNTIVEGASQIFQGLHQQVVDIIKKQMDNGSTLLTHKRAIVKIKEEFNAWTTAQ